MNQEEQTKSIIDFLTQLGLVLSSSSADPEQRAAKIQQENSNPEIKAAKEQKCKELIEKWKKWGII